MLFASDVVARGVDFPDVSLVVQLGIASSKEQFEHRVGRTGRAGKGGAALAILGEDERPVLDAQTSAAAGKSSIAPATKASAITGGLASGEPVEPLPELRRVLDSIRAGGEDSLRPLACRAFVASLGFYNTHLKRLRWTREQLIRSVVARFAALGVDPSCPVEPKTLKKMHLADTPGLVVLAKAEPPRMHVAVSASAPRATPTKNSKSRTGQRHALPQP